MYQDAPHLNVFEAYLGSSWAYLGHLLDRFGPVLHHLGPVLPHLGTVLALLGLVSAHLGPVLAHLGSWKACPWGGVLVLLSFLLGPKIVPNAVFDFLGVLFKYRL